GRRRPRTRTPARRTRDRTLDAPAQLGASAAAELAAHRLAVGRAARGAVMGRDVDQRGLHLLGVGVTELGAFQRLQVLVEQPGVVDRSLQDERLAPRDGGAVATQDRACGQLRTCDDVGTFGGRASRARAIGAWASSEWRIASG